MSRFVIGEQQGYIHLLLRIFFLHLMNFRVVHRFYTQYSCRRFSNMIRIIRLSERSNFNKYEKHVCIINGYRHKYTSATKGGI